jgi:CAAX amino terminal protease
MRTIKLIGKNIGVIVLSILVLIIGAIAEGLVQECFSGQYLRLVIPAFVRTVLTIVLAYFVSSKLLKMSAEELGLKLKKLDIKLWLISIALPLTVLVFYAYILPSKAYIAKPGSFWISLIRGIFSFGITAGICEELIFRGMIFRYMQRTLGLKAAVILPSLLFACAHIMNMESFNLTDLVLLILAGSSVAVMFTLFALQSDSIYPGAFAHTVWNTLIIGGVFGIGDTVNGVGNDSYIIIPIQSTNKLFTGGNFGVEAALPAIIGYIAVALMIGFLVKKESKNAHTESKNVRIFCLF